MLRISKLTDYATLILSYMEEKTEQLYSASCLAKKAGLSLSVVSKILKMLAQAGLLTSVRGVDGGYRLAQTLESISVAAVIAAIEGDFAVTECCRSTNDCFIKSACRTQTHWQRINQVIHKSLSQVSIRDLI